jgi:hypothetical protein
MVQMVMSMTSATLARDVHQKHGVLLARKVLGLAIVTSGYAVLLAHGVQHLFGG